MLAKFIAHKAINVTEQSVMLSGYLFGEILSARQKADNGRSLGRR